MMRSLFSGVSGLKSHQTRMDTIGNNIANVNTTGFKSSRTTFADTLSQTLSGASAPGELTGGTNAKQVGLGTGVASIDTIFTDGSVQSTGKNTDLCLSGNGLFVVNNGKQTYYTRDGAFEFDAAGNYVMSNSGLFVQGWTATNGELSTNGTAGKITIPSGKAMNPTATTTATYSNNLDSSTEGKKIASIVATYSDGTSETLTSYPSGTISLGMATGNTITLDSSATYDFTTGDSVKDKALYKTTINSVDATGGTVDLTIGAGSSVNSIKYADDSAFIVSGLTSGTYAIGDTYAIQGTIDTNGVTTAGIATGETQLTVTLTSPTELNGKQVKITVPTPENFTYADGNSVSFDLKIGEIDASVGTTVKTPKGDIKVVAKDIDSTLSTSDTTTKKLSVTTASQAYQYYGRDSYKTTINSVDATGGTVDLTIGAGSSVNSIKYADDSAFIVSGLTSGTYAIGDTYAIQGTIDTNGVTTAGIATGETQLTVTLTSPTELNGKQVKITVPTPENFTYADGNSVSFDLKIGEIDASVGTTVKTPKGDIKVVAKDIDSTLSTSDTTTKKLSVTTASQAYQYYGRDSDGTVGSVTRAEKKASSLTITTTDGTTSTGLAGKTYAKGDTYYSPVTTTITAYDSKGDAHSIPVLFTKTADNVWSLSLTGGTNSTTITESNNKETIVELTATDLVFDNSGKYVSGTASIKMTPSGADVATITASLSGLTQYSGSSTINASADGNAAGTLSSISIDSTGTITGTYTNGKKQTEAQVAVAQFNNASGLTKTGNSLYQASNNSGTANVKTASALGVTITPSALEMSNVDIANEFSDMIITQRGFQSNSKIITVGDEMLETLIGMKR